MTSLDDAIGYAAATCTTAAFVPQVLRVWQTRSVQDISLSMYVVFFIGVMLWCAYGVVLSSWPIIIANTLTLMLTGAVLWMKLTFGRVPAPGLSEPDRPAP